MQDRRCCGTCMHILAVHRGDGATQFYCSRLGYETRPGWRFLCWCERPPEVPMARKDADAD